MDFLTDIQQVQSINRTIGGKARNLYRLKEIGMNVPKWIVIPQETFADLIPQTIKTESAESIAAFIRNYSIPDSFIDRIVSCFQPDTFFAVRSSAPEEDGAEFSFAGMFESFLFVTKETLAEKIKLVWCSAFSERVTRYRINNQLNASAGISVIVQEMIHADSAGVAFGINPVNGDRKSRLISAVYGLGEGLVSGELNADHFTIKDNKIEAQLALKTERIVYDTQNKRGIRKVKVDEAKQQNACLTTDQIYTLIEIVNKCGKAYGKPQDIEFAVKHNTIYLLQSRPITNLSGIPDKQSDYILWDNSNIIESYPGVTTPLTFSFISKSYEGAYKLFVAYMGVDKKVIKEQEHVFSNTLGLINGRVYYNLKTWYHMLAMLPGYSINARFMEKMMGVKERFDVPSTYALSKSAAWWRVVRMVFKMYIRFITLPGKREAFMQLLQTTISTYKKIKYEEKNINELIQLYLDFEKKLLNEWKAPLLNDFFAMIWFGLLQKRCEKYHISKNPNIHNDLLCGSNDIISVQPIHRTVAIAVMVSEDEELKQLFSSHNEQTVWNILSNNRGEKHVSLKREIEQYIEDFGERCIGELKLETISYTQDPSRFIKIIQSYVNNTITTQTIAGKAEEEIRKKAEQELNNALKGKPLKKWRLKQTLKKARILVSSRENLRYERTRAFGIVREIFSELGKKLYAESLIGHPRDIFFLSIEEILAYVEGRSINKNINALIELRKIEFKTFEQQQTPSERFASYGPVYHANDFFDTGKMEIKTGDLKGIGCCPGIVRGNVKVILDPNEVTSLQGEILVTSSTDPGWVSLFPGASAILVERGSLLSHSAIVSREMGKPCIVSITGLLRTLKTGDVIEMDGSTGIIKIIHQP